MSKDLSLTLCEGTYSFPFGIPGFGSLTTWDLQKTEKKHFFSLKSLEDAELAFVLIDPLAVCADYDPNLDASDYSILQLSCAKDTNCHTLCIVTILDNVQEAGITINLSAPLIFNSVDKIAAQCLSLEERWSIRHKLTPAAKEKIYVDTL